MERVKHLLSALLLLLTLSAVSISCKKGEPIDPTPGPGPNPKPVATITSIDPATAPVGSTIAISGTNFGTDPASTSITIGGVPATVVSVSDTRIVVTVPAGVVNGPVAVTTGGQTVQSQASFALYVAPLKPVVEISGTLFSNQTWTRDKIYLLKGMVYIPTDFTLTIEPGTVIKGAGPELDPEKMNMYGTLVVERRGKLIAKGTPTQPIMFTSAKPAGQRAYGDWGGVVLIGKSMVNRPGTTPNPAGVRGTVERYGEPFDNSGTLQYVRIEYAGALQPNAAGNRLGGLSLYGVGAGTVIDHVQVSYSGSDAFKWFGGTANLKNLVAYHSFDDDWSADWGYSGNVQFGVAVRDPEVADRSTSNALELENFESGVNEDVTPVQRINDIPQTAPVFANLSSFAFGSAPSSAATSRGTGPYQAGLFLRRNAAISVYNSLFYGYPEGVRVEAASAASGLASGAIDLRGIVLANVPTPVTGSLAVTGDELTTYFSAADRTNRIVPSSEVATLLLNNFTASTSPSFLPRTDSPLLTGAVTGGKLASSFFTPVPFRGAFGTEDWTAGWTSFIPQVTDYDR